MPGLSDAVMARTSGGCATSTIPCQFSGHSVCGRFGPTARCHGPTDRPQRTTAPERGLRGFLGPHVQVSGWRVRLSEIGRDVPERMELVGRRAWGRRAGGPGRVRLGLRLPPVPRVRNAERGQGRGVHLRRVRPGVAGGVQLGLVPWEWTSQNLRSSFFIDLHERIPAHVASRWAGHADKTALAHYLDLPDEHFDRVSGREGAAESGGFALRNPVHPQPVGNRPELPVPSEVVERCSSGRSETAQVYIRPQRPVAPA